MPEPTTNSLNLRDRIDLATGQLNPYWLPDNPAYATFLNVLSIALVPSEAFVMRTTRALLPALSDPILRSEAEIFIKQEANHSHMHRQWNKALGQAGYTLVPKIEHAVQQQYAHYLEPPHDWQKAALLSVIFEQFTAALSRIMLKRLPQFINSADPYCCYLFTYHATEELEHQSLCVETYQNAFGHSPYLHPDFNCMRNTFRQCLTESLVRGVRYFLAIDQISKRVGMPEADLAIIRSWADEAYYNILQTSEQFEAVSPSLDRDLIKQWDQTWKPQLLKRLQTR